MYLSTLRMFGLKQLITDATRVTTLSFTLTDHILSSTSEKICQFGIITLSLSDHCMFFFFVFFCYEKGGQRSNQ